MTTLTTEEVLKMAKEAGIEEAYSLKHNQYLIRFKDGSLEAFAKLVAEAAASKERERISAKNKPEIEKCNAYIKHLELKLQASNVLRGEA